MFSNVIEILYLFYVAKVSKYFRATLYIFALISEYYILENPIKQKV